MNRAFQSYTPRVIPVDYDALRLDQGCQQTGETTMVGSVQPFAEVCVGTSSDPIFAKSPLKSCTFGPSAVGLPVPWYDLWWAWVADAGIRYAKVREVDLPSNSLGVPSEVFPSTRTTKLSFAFSIDSLPAIAIQKDAANIEIRYGSFGLVFAGLSPALFNTVSARSQTAELALYYLSASDRTKINVRLESEGFATEHVISRYLPFELAELVGTSASGRSGILFGKTNTGRDVTLTSVPYQVSLEPEEFADLSVAISSGRYAEVAIELDVNEDTGQIHTALTSGSYFSPIIPVAPESSGAAITITFSGSFT